ncbi:MogA/MoaB family molybdenum cofactor biosynthesis protein [Nesterenkonia sp. MY13]|uniref:MogA/MoaB family molybdenum cofactor biosynthesis protein n=1 Tax=Nesterenkonia sedimenti TaxID=1463632 RepID=A0A7X8TLK8_9MICC|nr:MogA/MoaB family molybdenum cofactor biosynthesis protein [Nesterenkonia sedimenti]NLS10938.1 MogA/MoaB family molybdenum cofactor biosynthesis protein [Nesterenkonia sedimenti]
MDDYDAEARVIAPVIVSTRAATGEREDESAPIIAQFAEQIGFICRPPVIIPDGEGVLAALSELLVQIEPAVIITSGGTGLTPDDLTPEYTKPMLDKEIPGVVEAIRAHGRTKNPLAALSRGVAGVKDSTVIINLPGSPKAVREGMEVLVELLPHLCDQVADIRDGHWGE